MTADEIEIRVLGCLVEKQRTTPDAYPLSLNALRLACNQATSREPVVDYDERTIHDALHRLRNRGWAQLTSGAGSRTVKYRHLLKDALGLNGAELSVLALLMLRGPQTAAELRQRGERLHRFDTVEEAEATLESLQGRELVVQLARRPGQKGERWTHLLGGEPGEEPGPTRAHTVVPPELGLGLEQRVAALERAVAVLAARLDAAGA